MTNVAFLLFCVVVIGAVVWIDHRSTLKKRNELNAMSSEERTELALVQNYGMLNTVMICPHCQTRGEVRTKAVVMKKGVSGAKATAAVLTAGISLVGTGLSRKENLTQSWCGAYKTLGSFDLLR